MKSSCWYRPESRWLALAAERAQDIRVKGLEIDWFMGYFEVLEPGSFVKVGGNDVCPPGSSSLYAYLGCPTSAPSLMVAFRQAQRALNQV